ncbi:hypothetical protein FB45DRAFT_1038331 [Roridomyces roridus]|uniref:Uncharacterized protein n=1 Tax=Roridomyces roridus TaxID=1738132 RepID=A0AAD7FBX3_9AGAR|nr:hypothetical protein FB45DRAFT_1038331 [Roridomyces roridus]
MSTPREQESQWVRDAADRDRRRRRAEAQARYRERNLDETRLKARLRMERLRERISYNPDLAATAAEQRRVSDAQYRERVRAKKFAIKFGERTLVEDYMPLHNIYGPYIVGHKFVWDNEAEKVQKRKKRK